MRNRIAHHEPIFARPLVEDHARILEVTGWMSLAARTWVERNSRVPELLAAANHAADGGRGWLRTFPALGATACISSTLRP